MKELVIELMESPSCCKEAKEACQNYLDSLGSDKENEMLELLITLVSGLIYYQCYKYLPSH